MNGVKIKSIHALEILDSRGNPTVRVRVESQNGIIGCASVPSGASTGIHEALELRDGEEARYSGKGVLKAAANVNEIIAQALVGTDVTEQSKIDQKMIELDGTVNKSRLGANAILGVSLASARVGARTVKKPLYRYIRETYNLQLATYNLPVPMMNILNGGRHADWCLDIQEFMLVPTAPLFKERVRAGAEIFHSLKKILKRDKYPTQVGDEGGFAVELGRNIDALLYLKKAIKKAGYVLGKDVFFAIDAAASEFYNGRRESYQLKLDEEELNTEEMIKMYKSWCRRLPIISIEDPLDQDDWEGWSEMTKQLGKKVMIVGDDFFVTDVKRLKRGIAKKAANAILIKPNQIGTLSETIEAIRLAQDNRYKVIISHRSGETCDTTIADLAVAVGAEYIKTGSLARSERVAKYNRLMEIEEEIK